MLLLFGRIMKIHLNNEPTDSYRIYLMDWECYAVRKTGDLFLQAMVPFPVSQKKCFQPRRS